MPAPSCCFRPPILFMKNSSRFDPTMERNFTRSRRGVLESLSFVEDPVVEVQPGEFPVQITLRSQEVEGTIVIREGKRGGVGRGPGTVLRG